MAYNHKLPKKISLKPKKHHGFQVFLWLLGLLLPPLGEFVFPVWLFLHKGRRQWRDGPLFLGHAVRGEIWFGHWTRWLILICSCGCSIRYWSRLLCQRILVYLRLWVAWFNFSNRFLLVSRYSVSFSQVRWAHLTLSAGILMSTGEQFLHPKHP